MPNAKLLLTPKELAGAIGASESSVRRWVDAGDIAMSRTAGGHRRIPVAEAVRFIRASGARVVRPEVLGLEDLRGVRADVSAAAGSDEDRLFDALAAGERRVARGILVSAYLSGRSFAEIVDGPVRGAMRRIGELWRHEARGILVEHRATEICAGAVEQFRDLLPAVDPAKAPLAVGGAPAGDPYAIPARVAGLVLAEAGFRDVNFGPDTPLELLADEAVGRGAALVWLSVSVPPRAPAGWGAVDQLGASLAAAGGVPLAVGGSHVGDYAPRGANVKVINSMVGLSAFAREVREASSRRPGRKAAKGKTLCADERGG